MGTSTLLFFLITLALGAAAGAGFFYWKSGKLTATKHTTQNSTILLERIEKVFKVVMTEGYFTEIFDYQDHKEFWYVFKNSKKALLIAKAKVLVGFDFSKMRCRLDDTTKKMIIEYFPEPEVLSIDTDYKFYDIENGLMNKFNSDDYTNLLNEAKTAMNEKALNSDLPRIANNQVQVMMFQLAASMNWQIEMQLPEANQKQLSELQTYEPLNAEPKKLPLNRGL
jgi:flagellar basal body-associated protein FliL